MTIDIRYSSATHRNDAIREEPAEPDERTSHWIDRVRATDGLLFLGGSSVADFRVRVAQAHVRHDLRPSLWSFVGILHDGLVTSVPLEMHDDVSEIPPNNAVRTRPIEDFDDPGRYKNVAVIRFSSDTRAILHHLARLKSQRSIVDLPGLLVAWLGFVWGAGQAGNPLLEGKGVPSAVFASTLFGIAGIELMPGASTAVACPEIIWQAARWWHEFYGEVARTEIGSNAPVVVPTGTYTLRQRSAAVAYPPDENQ